MVRHNGYCAWTEHEWLQCAPRTERDRRCCPSRDALRRGHDQDDGGALEARAASDDVHGPRKALPVVASELHFHDDREHWLAVDEEYNEIGAVLRRHDFRQVRRFDPHFCVQGQLDVERISEQFRRELGPIPEEQQECLVELGRHGEQDSTGGQILGRIPACSSTRRRVRQKALWRAHRATETKQTELAVTREMPSPRQSSKGQGRSLMLSKWCFRQSTLSVIAPRAHPSRRQGTSERSAPRMS
jgi:hypothetical protein